MKTRIILLFCLTIGITSWSQVDVADARTYGIGQTVVVNAVATNGDELGSIRYMQDNSAGIAGYGGPITGVSRGDSITVTGPLIEFSGLLEISTVTNVVNHGPAVIQPVALQIPIPSANEDLESELVEIQNVTFVESGNFAGNSTYTITDGSNNLDVRVNSGTDLVGTAIPTGTISITGLVGQFNTNYQIVPRDLNDIIAYVAPLKEINILLEGATVLTGSDYFIGNSSVINVTIENLGTGNLEVFGHSFSGPDAADFSSDIPVVTIAGGSTGSYVVNYAPSNIGSHFASIHVTSDDDDEPDYVINFEGAGTDDLATEPASNASALSFPLIEAYTLGGQYTGGTGATKYLVLWNNGSAVTGVPTDGTTYLRGDIIGDATVAYVGTGTSFTPRGIIANQDYHFAVYAFNGQGGFENYLTTSPAVGNTMSLGENIGAYYNGIDRYQSSLRTDLTTLINPHNFITYFMYKQTMMNEFEVRDTTNGQSVVTCVYSGENMIFDDPFDWTATGYSREHTFPHSWMLTWPADNPEQPEYTDQHNLYPANLNSANIPRSNLPLGEITGDTMQMYLEGGVGEETFGGQLVYEPRESHKGDAARAIMYMVVCYDFPLGANVNADKQDQDLLKTWHFNDLPDNKEIARHEYIYDLQNNRNPFIDSVDFACHVDFDDNSYLACNIGIEEQIQNAFVMFPIPSQDVVYLQVNGVEITSYEILDMSGRLIKGENNLNAPKIKVNNLASGSYLVTVTTEFGSAQKKMIVN
jgi:hypothetical protein